MRSIDWVCTKSDGWSWFGADAVTVNGIGNQLSGTINLEPDSNFWYLSGYLLLDGTVGTAAIRYYQADGQDWVQVYTDARGAWHDQPDASQLGTQTGTTGTSGGISLTAKF